MEKTIADRSSVGTYRQFVVHCHLRIAASLASTTALGYLRRHSSHVQQSSNACPIVCLHLKACNQWADCDHSSVSLPRPLFTRCMRYNAQEMHKVLDSSKRFLHTCSSSTVIFYCVPVTAMARLEAAAQVKSSIKAPVSAACEPRHQHSRLIKCTRFRPIGVGVNSICLKRLHSFDPIYSQSDTNYDWALDVHVW